MKKEEKNLSTEEKMLNRFKSCSEIVTIIEALIILVIIGVIISFINSCIESRFNMYEVRDSVLDYIGYDESEIIGITQHEAVSNVNKNVYLIGFILKVISIVAMVHSLRNILLDSIKQKTPFVKKNIERMKLMAICSIFSSQKLIYFVVIIMVEQLFKYGYELQVESDELL